MSNIDSSILAVIMIGGQSKRMGGGIKSLIEFNNKNIFERVLERAKKQAKWIIINNNITEEKFKKYDIPIIRDIKKNYLGPLAGIHSAMCWIKNNKPEIEWLVTLPGDTPFIPPNLISDLKNKITPKSKIILAQSGGKTHPIIGLWHVSLLKNLDEQLDLGLRKILSWANLHPIDFVNFSSKNYDPFFNINTKADVTKAEQIENYYL